MVLKIEIEIEEEFDVLPGAIAEACKLIVERLLDAERRVELGTTGERPKPEVFEFRTSAVEQEDGGLERREAALAHVLAELADVVERAGSGGRPVFLGVVQAVECRSATSCRRSRSRMGPPAVGTGHAEGFCLHVDEHGLDGRDHLPGYLPTGA